MKMIQTLENKFYQYDPKQYMPIYQDGELANRNEFYAYKAKQVASGIGHVSLVAFTATINALDTWVESVNKS